MTLDPPSASAPPAGTGSSSFKRLLPRTLFGRSMLIMMTPVILGQAIATFIFYDRHWQTMSRGLASSVAGDIAMVIEQLHRDHTPEERAHTLSMAARNAELQMSFREGDHLSATRQRLQGILERTLGRALDERVGLPWHVNIHVAPEIIGINVQLPDGVLYVLSPERRLFSFTSWLFIVWMLGSSSLLISIAIIFMRNQIRPIRRLAVAADAFGKGRDVPRFKPEGASEVRQAATAFLVMRQRIQRQITQRTEMLAGVSHDLRTPLTRMKLQLAMLGDGPEVAELQADVAEMEVMIEAYLAFARGEGEEAPQPIDIAALVGEVCANGRREGKPVDLTVAAGLPPQVTVRPNDLRRCLGNLVGNALRYAGHAWVGLAYEGGHLQITIDDDGPGIPPAAREDVFRPFMRLDDSRNPATGGVGLGLSIARDVANRHGGDVYLTDSPRGGLRATVRIPV